jgi:hypothetical protein
MELMEFVIVAFAAALGAFMSHSFIEFIRR